MTLIVEIGNPNTPQATALLAASHALMQSLFPAKDNHYLSIDALTAPDIDFFIAREGPEILGCAALKNHLAYGEIKSMFVDPASRGKGVADALMRQLIDQSTKLKLPLIKLETGNSLIAAHKFYRRHDFTLCGPFGDYIANETSIFMEKPLE